jgi:hypothetical protein
MQRVCSPPFIKVMKNPLDEKGLSRQCLNCAGNTVSWYAICLDCIHIREDATPQEELGLLRAVGRLALSELKIIEDLLESRKLMAIQSNKSLFDRPAGGRFSPQTRMDPSFLALSSGSVRAQRAVLVLADWLYEGICEVVEAHLPGVTYQSTDMYLSSVALFVHVAGEYALSQAGHIAQSWLLDRIAQSLVRDTVIDLHLKPVNYRISTSIYGNGDLNTQITGFIQRSEEEYASCEFLTGSLLEDMLDQHTLIGSFQKSASSCMEFTAIEDVAAIRFMVRRIITDILEQPWLHGSVADAVMER